MTTLCGAFDATQPPCHNWEGLHCCGKPPGHDGEHLCAGGDGRAWPNEPKQKAWRSMCPEHPLRISMGNFCTECGAPLKEIELPVCAFCGSMCSASDNFCTECGKKQEKVAGVGDEWDELALALVKASQKP